MVPVTVGLGSNLGDSAQNILNAAQALRERFGEIHLSPLYRTSPMYVSDQPDYINAAASFEVSIGPRQLLAELKFLESELGRTPGLRYGPRMLDLDLLTYGVLSFQSRGIAVPHPRLHERLFVLRPLCDLNPTMYIPGQGKVSELTEHEFVGQSVERVGTYADL